MRGISTSCYGSHWNFSKGKVFSWLYFTSQDTGSKRWGAAHSVSYARHPYQIHHKCKYLTLTVGTLSCSPFTVADTTITEGFNRKREKESPVYRIHLHSCQLLKMMNVPYIQYSNCSKKVPVH